MIVIYHLLLLQAQVNPEVLEVAEVEKLLILEEQVTHHLLVLHKELTEVLVDQIQIVEVVAVVEQLLQEQVFHQHL